MRLIIEKLVMTVTGAALLLHLALTVAYVLPLTPARMQYDRVVVPLVESYADQRWSLFAPNPLTSNESLLVKCIPRPEFERVHQPSDLGSDGWEDITTPLVHAHQRNRFTPYDRASRPQGARLREFFTGSSDLMTWHHACAKGAKDACRFEAEAMRVYRADAAAVLTAIASSYCFEAGRTDTYAVALRLRDVPTRPWSMRHDPSPIEGSDFDIGAFPAYRNIAPSRLFASTAP